MTINSSKPRAVAEINLEEFERRLRAAVAPQAGVEDPLAELTRLVDTIGFERKPSERTLETQRVVRTAPKPDIRLAPAPPPAVIAKPPAAIDPPAPVPVPALAPPPIAEAPPALRPSFDDEDHDSEAFEPPVASGAAEAVEASLAEPASVSPARAVRARHWGLKVGGLFAAAAVMAGAVVVFKVGGHARSGAPPLILASTAPTKVPPPSDSTIRTANENGSLLTRDTAQPTSTAPKLVDTPEAPVDLAARPAPSPTNVAAAAASPSPSASAADASPIAPSSDTPIIATVAPSATPSSPVGDDPSKVKTISVRPDGTLISSGYEANASAPAPAPAPAASPPPAQMADADTQAASPAAPLPTKLSPPKSAARVAAKTDTTAPADSADAPPPVTPKVKKPKAKATPVAEAEAKTDDADAPAAASGGFAVQLAAPKTEGEAKALIKRLQTRFGDALGGNALGVRKADRHGEPIYRVRAGGLSREDAKAMCDKIKASGGDCYVAKN